LKEKETARRGEILELAPEVIKRNWDYAVDALEQALELMTTRYGCLGERFVPLVDMIAPMAVIISSDKFTHTGDHLKMLDKWYWRSVFSQYYISATETKLQRTVRQWLSREGEKEGWLDNPNNEPDSVREFSYKSTALEDVSRVDNAVYRGVMSLLLSQNIRDFGPSRKKLMAAPWEELEDHHIYPKRFLSPYGIKGERVNNIANRTPLIRTTNGTIGNAAPHVYIVDRKIVGSEAIEPVISEHLMDSNLIQAPFTAELYDRFLADRKKRILAAIGAAVHAEPISEQP
jgi:hypothetical protein